ncbi:MAG: cytidine deaminase [Chloroflexi bacterium]|nr:cytidine deaminase [Chloroflexota bacterium]
MTTPPDARALARLLALARRARAAAYCPYSGFAVGAAVLGASGRWFSGANVENASYGLTVCAERVAVLTAVARGERALLALAVVTSSDPPAAPCGACRQVLWEFWHPLGREWPTVVPGAPSGPPSRSLSLAALLPDAFGPATLA